MKIKYKIQRLFDQMRKVDKEIEDLQAKCKHPNQIMKFVHKNRLSTSNTVRWVCEDCEKTLLWPTQAELKSFFRK